MRTGSRKKGSKTLRRSNIVRPPNQMFETQQNRARNRARESLEVFTAHHSKTKFIFSLISLKWKCKEKNCSAREITWFLRQAPSNRFFPASSFFLPIRLFFLLTCSLFFSLQLTRRPSPASASRHPANFSSLAVRIQSWIYTRSFSRTSWIVTQSIDWG